MQTNRTPAGRTATGQGRDGAATRWAGLLRLAAVIGIVAGFAVLTGPVMPRAAAGEPGARRSSGSASTR